MIIFKSFNKTEMLFWMLGFSSTASVLALIIGGHVLSLFTISIFVSFFILLKDKSNLKKSHPLAGKYYLAWTFVSLLSIVWAQIFFMGMPKWQSAPVSYLPKIIIYLAFYLLIMRNVNKEKYCYSIMQGIKVGIIVNLIWGIVDAVTFYSLGFSLTNTIFESYIIANNVRDGGLAVVENGNVFRTGGLNGDPSNIGLFAIILAFYALTKKKFHLLILCLLSVFSSISFIALLGMVVAFLAYAVVFRERKIIISGMCFLVALSLGFYLIYNSDNEVVQAAKVAFEYKLEMKSDTDASDVRVQFVTNFIPAVIQTPSSLLVGTGYMTASYAYRDGLLGRDTFPYDMENHYVSTFFDLGMIGFIFFIMMYYVLYKKIRISIKYAPSEYHFLLISCIIGALIAFTTYHFTLYSLNMIVCFCAMCYTPKGNNDVILVRNGKNYK